MCGDEANIPVKYAKIRFDITEDGGGFEVEVRADGESIEKITNHVLKLLDRVQIIKEETRKDKNSPEYC
jgi:hypothetical protein